MNDRPAFSSTRDSDAGCAVTSFSAANLADSSQVVVAYALIFKDYYNNQPQARFSGVTARGVVEEVVKKIPVPA